MSSKIILKEVNIIIVFLDYIILFIHIKVTLLGILSIFLTYTYNILLPLNGL